MVMVERWRVLRSKTRQVSEANNVIVNICAISSDTESVMNFVEERFRASSPRIFRASRNYENY